MNLVIVSASISELQFTNVDELASLFAKDPKNKVFILTYLPDSSTKIDWIQNCIHITCATPILEPLQPEYPYHQGLLELYNKALYQTFNELVKKNTIPPDSVIYFPTNYYAKYFVTDSTLKDKCFIDIVDIAWLEIKWMMDEQLWIPDKQITPIVSNFIQKGIAQNTIHQSATHLISPSNLTKIDMKQMYNKDSAIIPFNIRESDYLKPRIDNILTKHILVVSRIDPRKGIDLIINILPRLLKTYPDYTITIVGFSNIATKYISYLKQIKNPRVRFQYACSQEDKTELYRKSDLTIVPSKYDTFARTVIESLAQGTPVLASDNVGSASDLSGELPVKLFKNADSQSLCETLDTFLAFIIYSAKLNLLSDLRRKAVSISQRYTSQARKDALENYITTKTK